jgi:hypothetical protein
MTRHTEESWYGKCFGKGAVMPAHVVHDSLRSLTGADKWTALATAALHLMSGAHSRRHVRVAKASPTPFLYRGITVEWPPFAPRLSR